MRSNNKTRSCALECQHPAVVGIAWVEGGGWMGPVWDLKGQAGQPTVTLPRLQRAAL